VGYSLAVVLRITIYHIVYILLLALLIVVNYYGLQPVHAGDSMLGSSIVYPPPYKLVTRITIYDIPGNTTRTIYSYGVLAGVSSYVNRYDAVSVDASGPEIFVLLTSLVLIVYYHIYSRRSYYSGEYLRYYIELAVIVLTIALSLLYMVISYTPQDIAYILELDKPLKCTIAYSQRFCLLDVVENRSIVYLATREPVTLYIYRGGRVVDFVEVNSTNPFLAYVNESGSTRYIIVAKPGVELGMHYTRVYIKNVRDPYTPLYIVYGVIASMIMLPIIHNIVPRRRE
jgi:hypothetical protein